MSFDAEAYAQRLIQMGTSPEQARDIARKMEWGGSGNRRPLAPLAIPPALTAPAAPADPAAAPVSPAVVPTSVAPPTPPASAPAPMQQPPLIPETSNVVQGDLLSPANTSLNLPSKQRSRGRPRAEQAALSAREQDLFQLSLEIEQKNASESGDIGFLTTAMVFASLPHRRVWLNPDAPPEHRVEAEVYRRKAGRLQLAIWSPRGLPYGKIPRLITVYLCTQATKTQDPVIDLGRTQREFCERLGLFDSGGVRGDATRFKDQAWRLFTSAINLSSQSDSMSLDWENVSLTKRGSLNLRLWAPHEEGQRKVWINRLQLSTEFFEECINHPVPLDLRVLRQLRSPLAIDQYIWLTYRANSITTPTPISWRQLLFQFGAQYDDDEQGVRNFAHEFRTQLQRVKILYPGIRFSSDSHKLVLFPSKPHVSIAVSRG